MAAISWQWGLLRLVSVRPTVVSAADFRVPFSRSHFWLADIFGATLCHGITVVCAERLTGQLFGVVAGVFR